MRRIRRSTKRKWITLAAFLAVVGIWALCEATGIFYTEDRFLPQAVAYAQETAEVPKTVQSTPTHVDSGVQINLSNIVWEGATAYVNLPDGRKAKLSLDKSIQESA